MHASTRRTLGVVGVLATAMILLVVAPRQRVGGRHRHLGAQVHERGLRQPRSHLTARHRRSHSGSGVAMRIIITRGVSQVPLSAWGQRNAGNLLDVRRSTTRGERDVGCSQSCSKTWCDALGRLRRAETVGLCMPRLHGTCETRCERLDGPRAAHNPEVGGSNPADDALAVVLLRAVPGTEPMSRRSRWTSKSRGRPRAHREGLRRGQADTRSAPRCAAG
jgi:hypothetical protein